MTLKIFADDLLIISPTKSGLIILLSVLNPWCVDFKMKISETKSKIVSVHLVFFSVHLVFFSVHLVFFQCTSCFLQCTSCFVSVHLVFSVYILFSSFSVHLVFFRVYILFSFSVYILFSSQCTSCFLRVRSSGYCRANRRE